MHIFMEYISTQIKTIWVDIYDMDKDIHTVRLADHTEHVTPGMRFMLQVKAGVPRAGYHTTT